MEGLKLSTTKCLVLTRDFLFKKTIAFLFWFWTLKHVDTCFDRQCARAKGPK